MWGPRWIAKLVQITPITMVYGTYNYSFHGVYKPTNITEGPHIVFPHSLRPTQRHELSAQVAAWPSSEWAAPIAPRWRLGGVDMVTGQGELST